MSYLVVRGDEGWKFPTLGKAYAFVQRQLARKNPTTYLRLKSGQWALRGAGLREGETVTVERRDGSRKTETVGRIIWEGSGVTVAQIEKEPRYAPGEQLRWCGRCGGFVRSGSRCWVDRLPHF